MRQRLQSISTKLGAKQKDEANRFATALVYFAFIFAIILSVGTILFSNTILGYLDTPAEIYQDSHDYLIGISFDYLGLILLNLYMAIRQSAGDSKSGVKLNAIASILNVFLDPLFIFVFDLGVKGAAIATIISQFVSALWVLYFLSGGDTIIKLKRESMHLKLCLVKEIITLGMSGFVMAITNSLVQIVCNATLQQYGGDIYISVMTVLNSIREVITMPVSGITNGFPTGL